MQDKELQRRIRLIAGAGNTVKDVLVILEIMAQQAADVSVPLNLGVSDTLEVRKAIHSYLTEQINRIKRVAYTEPKEDDLSDDVG